MSEMLPKPSSPSYASTPQAFSPEQHSSDDAKETPPRFSPPTPPLDAVRVEEPARAPTTSSALDARQDNVMAVVSIDGRPPSRPQRILEWRWVGIGGGLLIAAIAGWMLIKGVSLIAAVAGLAIGVLLLVGAIPVLAAAHLRVREERAARRIAERTSRETPDR